MDSLLKDLFNYMDDLGKKSKLSEKKEIFGLKYNIIKSIQLLYYVFNTIIP